jgi:threonine synthase
MQHFSECDLPLGEYGRGFRYEQPFEWPPSSKDRSLWRFRRRLPIGLDTEPVSLGEGGTPLLASKVIPRVSLYWKDETRNPTGSHKDRALSVAATHALAIGARTMAVVSAGSTGISSAAYAARAGLNSITLTGRGTPSARTYPVFALGSRLIEVDAGIDEVIVALDSLNGQNGLYVCSTTRSSNPYQAEGPKTIAYEIVEDLGRAPDWLVVPSGGGGTISGVWRGFMELQNAGYVRQPPRLLAVVPQAYDALANALAAGLAERSAFAALPYRGDTPTVLTKLSMRTHPMASRRLPHSGRRAAWFCP